MTNNSIVIVPYRCVIWLLATLPFLMSLGVLLSAMFHESWEGERGDGYLISGIVFLVGAIIFCIPYMFRIKDTYTAEGFTRRKGKKIKSEIKWSEVTWVGYRRFTLLSLLEGCPWVCYISLSSIKDGEYREAETFTTAFSRRELKKIQAIIPIRIDVR